MSLLTLLWWLLFVTAIACLARRIPVFAGDIVVWSLVLLVMVVVLSGSVHLS